MLPEWLDALIWFQLLPELEPLPPSAAQTDLGIRARRDETPFVGRAMLTVSWWADSVRQHAVLMRFGAVKEPN
jgi:hypothetical protein